MRSALALACLALASCSPPPRIAPAFPHPLSQRVDIPFRRVTLHAIVDLPRAVSPAPTVVLLQGWGCESIDPPDSAPSPLTRLLGALRDAGFATVRVDKSGVGRSAGPPCRDTDFDAEVDGFRTALQAIRAYPAVRPDRLFLFGWSLGGTVAPLIADDPIAGIVVYGADPLPWTTYDLRNSDRQWRLQGASPAERSAWSANLAAFDDALLAGDLPTPELARKHPWFASRFDDPAHLFGRSLDFLRQLARTNTADPWRAIRTDVLVLSGDADFVSAPEDQAKIVELVRESSTAHASAVRIPCADHWMRTACTMADSMALPGEGQLQPEIARTAIPWLRERSLRPPLNPNDAR